MLLQHPARRQAPRVPSQYDIVNKFLLPLAVPLLLFSADLRRVILGTGKLIVAFCLGSVGTLLATLVAFKFLPMKSLGAEAWKVAAALAARHIGGAVNYVSVGAATDMSSAVLTAGLAADNLVVAFYFMSLYAMARSIPPEDGEGGSPHVAEEGTLPMNAMDGAIAVATSATICYVSVLVTNAMHLKGSIIPVATGEAGSLA